MHPEKDASLGQYEWLINWYKEEYLRAAAGHEKGDPVLGMRGVGKKIWQSMDADEYVADLRRGWE